MTTPVEPEGTVATEASTRETPPPQPLLIYGAYGFTGRLLVREAVARGLRPVLAGRRRQPLEALARELDLPWRVAALDRPRELRASLGDIELVIHAAGPFIRTAPPMVAVCLDAGVHYIDITGEVPVFEAIYDLDERARDAGVVLIPGVGFDVVPTDAVATLLRRALPDATSLEIGVFSPGPASGGTLATVCEHLPGGLWVRRNGLLEQIRPGRPDLLAEIDFGPGDPGGVRRVTPYTWGDLSSAWRSTGIPNITCYMVTSRRTARLLPSVLPLLRVGLSIPPIRRAAQGWIRRTARGPSREIREEGRTRLWGRVTEEAGRTASAILETLEAYRFTAVAGIRAAEEVLATSSPLAGAHTPSTAFGPEWALGLPGTHLVRKPGDP
jgi:short subunit dehydrogenase-like uncharacterized protein